MVSICLTMIIVVLIVLAVPRIWWKLSVPAAGRRAGSGTAAGPKR
jgi:hypothetical protein